MWKAFVAVCMCKLMCMVQIDASVKLKREPLVCSLKHITLYLANLNDNNFQMIQW